MVQCERNVVFSYLMFSYFLSKTRINMSSKFMTIIFGYHNLLSFVNALNPLGAQNIQWIETENTHWVSTNAYIQQYILKIAAQKQTIELCVFLLNVHNRSNQAWSISHNQSTPPWNIVKESMGTMNHNLFQAYKFI